MKCKVMFIKFINDKEFTKDYKVKCRKEYYKNVRYLIGQMFKNKRYKNLIKEILHFLLFPLWTMYIKNKK